MGRTEDNPYFQLPSSILASNPIQFHLCYLLSQGPNNDRHDESDHEARSVLLGRQSQTREFDDRNAAWQLSCNKPKRISRRMLRTMTLAIGSRGALACPTHCALHCRGLVKKAWRLRRGSIGFCMGLRVVGSSRSADHSSRK